MTHLQTLTEAFDKVGISYVIRDHPNRGSRGEKYQYLFMIGEHDRDYCETEDLGFLTRTRRYYIEFMNGDIASY